MASNNINILNSLKVGIRSFPKDIFLNYDVPHKNLVMTLTKKQLVFLILLICKIIELVLKRGA